MALYPTSAGDRRFATETLEDVAARIFQAAGMSAPDARLVANSLVAADRRGIHSHGVLRVIDYVRKLLHEGVDPKGRPRIVSAKGGAIRIDGANALGQVAGAFAMDTAVAAAREHGVAFAAVGGSNHAGALEFFTLRAAAAGMIGLAGTNALPTMAPWGGVEKIVGLNPLSVAMPAADRPPFVLDVALGATAHGKIRVYAQKGEPLPDGWSFDAEGRPTTDAAAALDGLIQPIGAFKGIGLAVAVGLLSTMLTDAGYGLESGNMVDGAYAGRDGQFYMAIDIGAFVDPATFARRVTGAMDQIEQSRRKAGVDRIYAPGGLEASIAVEYDRSGIPLSAATVATIIEAAELAGVDASELTSADAG